MRVPLVKYVCFGILFLGYVNLFPVNSAIAANGCAREAGAKGSSYDPTRNSLVISKSPNDDPEFLTWDFGYQLMGAVFPLQIIGFDRIVPAVNGNLMGMSGDKSIVIGTYSDQVSEGPGDLGYSVLTRKVILNDNARLNFEEFESKGKKYWRAIFNTQPASPVELTAKITASLSSGKGASGPGWIQFLKDYTSPATLKPRDISVNSTLYPDGHRLYDIKLYLRDNINTVIYFWDISLVRKDSGEYELVIPRYDFVND